ncbi:MAG: tetratricopeptide repeat protein, partial [Acidobacteriota bacterium]
MRIHNRLCLLGVFCVALIAAQAFAQADLWEEHINAGIEAYQLGDNTEAEKQFLAAVGEAENFGPKDPRLAQSLNNLAGLYNSQGKYAEAEPLYRRALAIAEAILGPEHPNVAPGINNLGALYLAQGKYAEAEPLFQRSQAIWEKALGPEHPDVALSLGNLASVYQAQRNYEAAEPLAARSVAILQKALGPEHPNVA